jgi:hypothetical protein
MEQVTFKKTVSPKGTVGPYCKLTVADVYEGKTEFKCAVVFDPAEEGVNDYIKDIEAAADAGYAKGIAEIDKDLETAKGAKLNSLKERRDNLIRSCPVKDEVAEDGSPTGRYLVNFKRTAKGVYRFGKDQGKSWSIKLPIFDTKKKPITESEGEIYEGSTLRIQALLKTYTMPTRAGVSMNIRAVQVINLISRADGGGDASGFDIEEGYEASEVERVVSKGEPSESYQDDSSDF